MENKEIKLKSYQFLAQNLGVLLALLFGIPALIIAIFVRPFLIPAVASFGGISLIVICIILILRFGCKTYDIYNEKGMKRVRGEKIVFEFEWADVESAMYLSFIGIIICRQYTLILYLKKRIRGEKNWEFRNNDSSKCIFVPMSKAKLREIKKFIPPEVLNVDVHSSGTKC